MLFNMQSVHVCTPGYSEKWFCKSKHILWYQTWKTIWDNLRQGREWYLAYTVRDQTEAGLRNLVCLSLGPTLYNPTQVREAWWCIFSVRWTLRSCAVQYGSHEHKPHVVTEHLKCGLSRLQCTSIVQYVADFKD